MTEHTATPPTDDSDSVTINGTTIHEGDIIEVAEDGRHTVDGPVDEIIPETGQLMFGIWVLNIDKDLSDLEINILHRADE